MEHFFKIDANPIQTWPIYENPVISIIVNSYIFRLQARIVFLFAYMTQAKKNPESSGNLPVYHYYSFKRKYVGCDKECSVLLDITYIVYT